MATRITRQTGLVVSESEGRTRVSRQGGLIVSETVPLTRVTRQGLLTVSEPESVVRASRQALLVVSEVTPSVRVSRQGLLVVSQTLGEGTQPPSLPAVLPNPIPANWVQDIQLSNVYQTDVSRAYSTLAEERRGLRDRPRRSLAVTFTAMSRDEGNQVLMNLFRLSSERVPVPLFCDPSLLTSAYSSGTTLDLDTRWRRFAVGVQVIVLDHLGNFAYGIIDSLTSSQITLQSALVGTFPEGAVVYPVLTGEASLRSDAKFETDSHLQARISFSEIDGKGAIKLPDYDPSSDFTYHDGFPVLDTPIQWGKEVTASATRAGSSFSSGRTKVVELEGEGPQLIHKVAFLQCSRQEAWPVIRFNDYARGRKQPFWILAPEALFILEDLAVTHADVTPSGNVDDLIDYIKYVALVLNDGTWQIREVSSVTLVSSVWRITFDSTITVPASLDLVERFTSAHFVRNVGDEFKESWNTDGVVSLEMTVIDLVNEKDVPITDLVETLMPTGIQDIADLQIYCDVCRNAFNKDDLPAMPYPIDQVDNGECKTWGDVRNTSPSQSPACRQPTKSERANLTLFHDPTINNNKPSMGSTTVDPTGPKTNLLVSSNVFTAGQPSAPLPGWNFLFNTTAYPTVEPSASIAGPLPGLDGWVMNWRSNTGSNPDRIFQVVPGSLLMLDEIYTASIYVKQETAGTSPTAATKVMWELVNLNTNHYARVEFTFATEAAALTENAPTNIFVDSGTEDVGDGWFRLWATLEYVDPAPLDDKGMRVGMYIAGLSPSELPGHPGNGDIDADHVCSAWSGAQLEQGIDPASYNDPNFQDNSQWDLHFTDAGTEPLTPNSNDGLTVVMNVHLPSDTGFDATWFDIKDGSGDGIFYWDNDEIRLYDLAGAEITSLTLSSFNMAQGELVTAIFRWQPGGVAELYFNGVSQESAADAGELNLNNDDISAAFSRLFNVAGLSIPGTDDALDTFPFYNAFAIYARALTADEMNQIGNHFASVYNGSWTDI